MSRSNRRRQNRLNYCVINGRAGGKGVLIFCVFQKMYLHVLECGRAFDYDELIETTVYFDCFLEETAHGGLFKTSVLIKLLSLWTNAVISEPS